MEGSIKAPPQGVPELLPVYIITILGYVQDSDPHAALKGPLYFPFGLLVNLTVRVNTTKREIQQAQLEHYFLRCVS